MERRRRKRINIQMACRVSEPQRANFREAIIENLSEEGFLLRWMDGEPLPEVESQLTVEITLPFAPEMPSREMRFEARVVRIIWPTAERPSVALEIARGTFSQLLQ